MDGFGLAAGTETRTDPKQALATADMEQGMKLTPKQRGILRMKFGGRCAYCGCELPEKGWHADHVEAALRKWKFGPRRQDGTRRTVATGDHWRPENDVMENLFPACAPCNLFKATFTLETFRGEVAEQAERARQ